jgi:hypothetical protein
VLFFGVVSQHGQAAASAGQCQTVFAELAKILGSEFSFSAEGNFTVKRVSQPDPVKFAMSIKCLDGNLRGEIDFRTVPPEQARAAGIPPGLDRLGLDRVIVLAFPEKKQVFLLCPGLRAYCEAPSGAITAAGAAARTYRSDLGKETIDGHPCLKKSVTVTGANFQGAKAIRWEATDMKGFPIKSEVRSGADTILVKFANVKLQRSGSSLFMIPAGYERYETFQDLAVAAAQQAVLKQLGRR